MQAIILAAGQGSRMKELIQNTPKCLLKVNKKPIIYYVLESIPREIEEIIILKNNQTGGKIRKEIENKFPNKNIKYIESKKYNGTAGALWEAKPYIKNEFIVLNGDDIIPKSEIKSLIKNNLAFSVSKTVAPNDKYLEIITKNDYIKEMRRINKNKIDEPINIATGTYKLDKRIFKYKPVTIKDGKELGLPQTIIKMAQKHKIKAHYIKNWISINTKEELDKANLILNSNK